MNTQPDDLIEAALRTYPLAQLPVDFSERVMRQVRATPATARASAASPAPVMRFRITWMDCALALFVSVLPLVGLGLWFFMPHQTLLQLQFQWQVFQWDSLQPVLLVSFGAAGVLLLLALFFSLDLVLRPRAVAR